MWKAIEGQIKPDLVLTGLNELKVISKSNLDKTTSKIIFYIVFIVFKGKVRQTF